MHPAVVLRRPFLTLEQAAWFLQVPVAEASLRYEREELPRALASDGGVFEPTAGKTLIPFLEFRACVSGATSEALEAWQRGELDVPKATSRTANPEPLPQ